MTTFAKPTPITRQVTIALCALRAARKDGDATSEVLRRKLDALPTPARTLAEMDPELDARLRVK